MRLLVLQHHSTSDVRVVEGRVSKAVEVELGCDALEGGEMARGGRRARSTCGSAGQTLRRKHPCAWYRGCCWGGARQVRKTEQQGRTKGGKGTRSHWLQRHSKGWRVVRQGQAWQVNVRECAVHCGAAGGEQCAALLGGSTERRNVQRDVASDVASKATV